MQTKIIEYQTLYSISISNMANKKIKENIDESNKIIDEKLFNYTEDEQGNIQLNKEIYELIDNTRYEIYEMDKNHWNYYEDLIEEVHKCLNLRNATRKEEKNKVGRPPKKNQNTNINQTTIDTFIKKAYKGEEKNGNEQMDLDK